MIPQGQRVISGARRESARFSRGGCFRSDAPVSLSLAPVVAMPFPCVSRDCDPCLQGDRASVARQVAPRVSRALRHILACGPKVARRANCNRLSCGGRAQMAGCALSGARLCGEYQCRKSLKSSASSPLLALSPLAVKPLLSAPQPAPSLVQPLLWQPAKTSPTAASSVARSALFRARSCRPHRTATNICQDIARGIAPVH